MEFELLYTNRLQLRKLTPEVFNYIFKYYSKNEIITFLGLTSEAAFHKEQEKYNLGLATFNKSFLYFQLIERSSNNILGWCGYHTWYRDHNRAEIGYVLDNDAYKRQGIMSEAIAPIIEYGFGTMNLHRIEAYIALYNEPSLKIIKNLHFKLEGHLKEHYCANNQMEDSLLFALLKHEYSNVLSGA